MINEVEINIGAEINSDEIRIQVKSPPSQIKIEMLKTTLSPIQTLNFKSANKGNFFRLFSI